ncbi:MAG TPA: vWA domain-containing protein, partial [Thermoplasmata archaeon]|nr:vWA domain-containing protein [Thermoplasmata archaeon]
MIVLTGGCRDSNRDTAGQVDRALADAITLYFVGLYESQNSSAKLKCEARLENWSKVTGGNYYLIRNPSDLIQVYMDIVVAAYQQTILVYDNSASMSSSDPLAKRCEAIRQYANYTRGPVRLGAVGFSDGARLDHGLTDNSTALKSSLSCTASGATNMRAALKTANDELIPYVPGRQKAIVFLTDGCFDIGGDPGPEAERAITSKVRLFTIGLYPSGDSPERLRCEPLFRDWANRSGGGYFRTLSPDELKLIYSRVYSVVEG